MTCIYHEKCGLSIPWKRFVVQHIDFVLYTFQAIVGTVIAFFVYGLVAGFVYLQQKPFLPLTIVHWENSFVGLGLDQLIQVLSMH